MATGYITRRFKFSASHRMWIKDWDKEKNLEFFGNRTSPYGHGHNYILDVTLKGEINPITGMVINLSEVKKIIGEVVDRFDHTFLNKDLPYFNEIQPTAENLARLFWLLIEEKMVPGVFLHRIRLFITEDVFAEYFGHEDSIFSKVFRFSATHRLHSSKLSDEANEKLYGKCNNKNGHGHNYVLTVYYRSIPDTQTGMTIPMSELDRTVKEFLKQKLAGKRLDIEVDEFSDKPSTSEHLLNYIKTSLTQLLGDSLVKVKLKETDNNFFESGERYG